MTSWCADLIFLRRCQRQFSVQFAALVASLLFFCGTPAIDAHPPLPDSVLNPGSAPEAWNVLRLAVTNIDRLVQENRLAEIPDQASLCNPALRMLARLAADPAQSRVSFTAETVHAGSTVNALAQAAVAGDRAGVVRMLARLHGDFDRLANGIDPRTVNADVFLCPMHPEVVALDPAALCPKCGMPLVARRIPYSFVYVAPPGESSMQLTAQCDAPPEGGRPCHVKIRLTRLDGTPVNGSDLLLTHTQKIHLLIIDSELQDYHHEHPTPTAVAGESEFTFTPAKSGPYRIFADVTPAQTGLQEYVMADLPGATASTFEATTVAREENSLTAQVGGYYFRLAASGPAGSIIRARQTCALQLSVSDAAGQPVADLEPVMNAFAHLVGFYDDRRTVVHLHPGGPEVTDASARGGPALEFRFYPPRAGYLRLFCQVVIRGETIYVPFSVTVAP